MFEVIVLAKVITMENAEHILRTLREMGYDKEVSTGIIRAVAARVLRAPQRSTITIMLRGMGDMGMIKPKGMGVFEILSSGEEDDQETTDTHI